MGIGERNLKWSKLFELSKEAAVSDGQQILLRASEFRDIHKLFKTMDVLSMLIQNEIEKSGEADVVIIQETRHVSGNSAKDSMDLTIGTEKVIAMGEQLKEVKEVTEFVAKASIKKRQTPFLKATGKV